jgi:hypothetical protein
MSVNTRHALICHQLRELERESVIRDWYSYHPGTGTRWILTPYGYGERSLTTSQVEDFIMGAWAMRNAILDPDPRL